MGIKKIEITCRHCPYYYKQVETFNATKNRSHLVLNCTGLAPEEKRLISLGFQANRHAGDMLAYSAGTFATLDDMRNRALNGTRATRGVLVDLTQESSVASSVSSALLTQPGLESSQPSSIFSTSTPSSISSSSTVGTTARRQTTIDSTRHFGPPMTQAKADKIIFGKLKMILALGLPLSLILDDHVRENMISDHGTGLIKFLPRHDDTVYNSYVIPLDEWANEQLELMMKKLPGMMNLSMDGATVNGKQKVSTTSLCVSCSNSNTRLTIHLCQLLYVVSRGAVSKFMTWTDLGSNKHVVAAEVDDAERVIRDAMETYNCKIASIQVDNAARNVAHKTTERFPSNVMMVTRDPSHCLDLLSKDLSGNWVVVLVVDDVKELRDFVRTDRIDSIRLEAAAAGRLQNSHAFATMSETRMNDVDLCIKSGLDQMQFIKTIWLDPNFKAYYEGLAPAKKAKLKAMLDRFNENAPWERMTMLRECLTSRFTLVHKALSRADFPLSAYVLLTQALRNDINRSFATDAFDQLFGDGARAAIADLIRERFNMDGRDPSGRKVGLHDRHHLMAYLVDPFNCVWRSKFKLPTDLAELLTEMIELFVPLDEDGSSKKRDQVRADFMVSVCFVRFCITIPLLLVLRTYSSHAYPGLLHTHW